MPKSLKRLIPEEKEDKTCVNILLFGLYFGIPVIVEYAKTRMVLAIPSAILAVGSFVLAGIAITSGIILTTVVKLSRENYEKGVTIYNIPKQKGKS